MPPLRVLYVNHMPTPAGCVRSLRFLIESFPKGAVEAHAVTPPGRGAEELARSGVRIHEIPAISLFQNIAGIPVRGWRWGTVLRALVQMRHGGRLSRILREVKPDLVHLNEHGMIQAAALARRARIPVVMTVRCVADRESRWQGSLLRHYARRFVDRVVAIDESVRRSIRELPGVRVVYNPLDFACGAAPAPRPGGNGTVNIAFLAGLADFKGIDDLLGAAQILRDRREIRFLLYGENRWPDAYYRSPKGRLAGALGITTDVASAIRARIDRDGLQETVRLMGHVPAEQGLAQADILVFPARLNGTGRSVFEAGIREIPSVVTLKDRVEDIVEDGRTGFIAPERDPKALADALRRLADDAGLRRAMGLRAREKYARQFDPARIGAAMLELYRELLGAKP